MHPEQSGDECAHHLVLVVVLVYVAGACREQPLGRDTLRNRCMQTGSKRCKVSGRVQG
jgi:hypothetical protein